jgi:hypothetical protein
MKGPRIVGARQCLDRIRGEVNDPSVCRSTIFVSSMKIKCQVHGLRVELGCE